MANNYIHDISGLDFFEQIAMNTVWGKSMVYKFGRTETQANKRAPVWDGNDNYIFPEVAATITLTSTDVGDVIDGPGAWYVHIFGLDENWESAVDTVEIGDTSTIKFIRVFRMIVLACGTSEFPYNGTQIGNNIGDLIATHNDTGLPVAVIQAGNGQTLMALFTVPKGYVALMWSAKAEIGAGKEATGMLYTKNNAFANTAWRVRGIRDMYQNSVGNVFKIPTVYGPMTDILLAVFSAFSGHNVTATFQLELIKEEFYNSAGVI